ncbi:MAG: Trk system potassium transporter TrkA [Peptoniphilaceae bacterium]|nr:Trk system potassium transporter TrkA [Peptoniphilaceae bacterium]MDD7383727.1 Trk system potassium transporter TrkA [Peptoniphilaceae bacterium]MDY3737874.1 Trk system potassium transporter TrkA [Peptoniphilaceae bacterium]
MKIIIVGAGKVGSYITSQLSNEGHDIIVIDKDKEVLDRLLAENDVMGAVGSGTNNDILNEVGVKNCDFLISVTYNDDTNIISAIMAKKLGVKYSVARVRNPEYMKHMEFMRESLGVDLLVNPEYLAAKEIQRTLKYPKALNVEAFFHGLVNMIQINVSDTAFIANRSIYEISKDFNMKRLLITMVSRNGETYIPNGSFVLKPRDKIYVAGDSKDLGIFYSGVCTRDNRKLKKVLIIGAGKICYYLSDLLLKRGFEIKVIESDREKAKNYLATHKKVDVILADGTNPEVLSEERIEEQDALVALTGIDEENILVSLLAEKLNIPKVIAKVDRVSLLRITGLLDVDTTVAPKKSVANVIIRMVRSKEKSTTSTVKALYKLEDNRVEALEFDVNEKSKIVNKRLKDLNFKKEVLVAYISHNYEIKVANGEDIIKPGDSVLVITKEMNINEIDEVLEK